MLSPAAKKVLSSLVDPGGEGPKMVSQHDPLGNYTYASPEAVDVVGWRADALVGNSSADMVHDADVETVADAYAVAVDRRRPVLITCRVIDEEGRPRWVRSVFRAVQDEGRFLFIAATRRVPAPESRRSSFKEVSEDDAAAPPGPDPS